MHDGLQVQHVADEPALQLKASSRGWDGHRRHG
jgi:hypothetical protein